MRYTAPLPLEVPQSWRRPSPSESPLRMWSGRRLCLAAATLSDSRTANPLLRCCRDFDPWLASDSSPCSSMQQINRVLSEQSAKGQIASGQSSRLLMADYGEC